MAQIKGVLLNAWMELLKNRYGERALSQAFSTLGRDDPALLSSFFLASNWYPYSTLDALSKVSRVLATPPAISLAPEEIGRGMAEYVFKGAYRPLLVKDPIKQIEKFCSIDDFFFQDTYELETSVTGEHGCLVRYRFAPGTRPRRSICQSLGGFWSRMLELAGAEDVKSRHTNCVTNGDPCCDFVLDWRSASSRPA